MKFELFGKLRDKNGENEENVTGNTQPEQNQGMAEMGSSLENTVERMFSQGYSEEEIRQELQGQYSQNEIQKAVNRVVKSSAASGSSNGPQPMSQYQGEQEPASPMDQGFNQEQQIQNSEPQIDSNPVQNSPEPQTPIPRQGQQKEEEKEEVGVEQEVEELIETIVAENFQMVEEEFENVYSEIDDLQDRVNELENRVHDLEVRDDEDQQQFIQKMDDIEDDINSYQSRIGGLEKAFQQVLPSLVDNVRELTQLVQEIKQERGIETSATVSEDDIKNLEMDEDWD